MKNRIAVLLLPALILIACMTAFAEDDDRKYPGPSPQEWDRTRDSSRKEKERAFRTQEPALLSAFLYHIETNVPELPPKVWGLFRVVDYEETFQTPVRA